MPEDLSLTNGITVGGTGETRVVPDTVFVNLGIEFSAPRAADARLSAADAAHRLTDSLRAAGVADRDIQTAHISLQAQYDYGNGTQTLRGYTAASTLSLTLRDISASGAIIDSALDAAGDAGRLNNLRFGFSNPAAAYAEARRAAVHDAFERAGTLAEAARLRLGPVVSIVELSGANAPSPKRLMAERASATPIEPGESTLTVSLVVQFSIAGARRKKRG